MKVNLWTYGSVWQCTTVLPAITAVLHVTTQEVWACDETPPIGMIIGAYVKTASASANTSLRADHSAAAKIEGLLPLGRSLIIRGGPVCEDNIIWYRIRYKGKPWWVPVKKDGITFLILKE